MVIRASSGCLQHIEHKTLAGDRAFDCVAHFVSYFVQGDGFCDALNGPAALRMRVFVVEIELGDGARESLMERMMVRGSILFSAL